MTLTESLRLVISGDSKSAVRALKDVDHEVDGLGNTTASLSGGLARVKGGFGQMFTGKFRGGLSEVKGGLSEMLTSLGKGPVIIAAVTAAMVVLVKIGQKAVAEYKKVASTILGMSRITGMEAGESLDLYAQFRMSGIDATAGSRALGLFTKNLYAARAGSGAAAEALAAMGVNLKNAKGGWRDAADVLADVRNRLSQTEDATARAGQAAALFGRGFKELLPWLTKSSAEIQRYNQIVRESGLKFNGKAVKDYKDFVAAQRESQLRWELMWASVGQKLIPTLNEFLPKLNRALVSLGKILDVLFWIEDKTRGVRGAFAGLVNPLMDVWGLAGRILTLFTMIKDAISYAVTNAPRIATATTPWGILGSIIPGLASGGIVKATPGGTIVRIGEGGQDEIVAPIPKSAGRGVRGGGMELHIHIDKVMGTDRKAAQQLAGMVGDVLMSGVLRQMVGQNA